MRHVLRAVFIRDMSEACLFGTPFPRLSIFRPLGGIPVKQLIAYLLDHAIIDFSGDLTLDMVRDFLREDDSPEGRKLLGKLVEDRGVDDMVVTLADCLQDYLWQRGRLILRQRRWAAGCLFQAPFN